MGASSSLAQSRSILVYLRFGQRGPRPLEHGARVGHGLVQHEGEEVVGEVVVLGDVALVVVPARGGQAGRDVEYRTPGPPQPVQTLTQRAGVAGQGPHQRGEVVGVPPAGHVRGPEADRARAQQGAVGATVVHRHPGHGLTPAQPERLAPLGDLDRRATGAPSGRQHDPAGQAAGSRRRPRVAWRRIAPGRARLRWPVLRRRRHRCRRPRSMPVPVPSAPSCPRPCRPDRASRRSRSVARSPLGPRPV